MREIKFRAWYEKFNKMYIVKGIDFQSEIAYFDKNNYRSIYDVELMQYTGLKDEYGDEIYEGDIVTLHNSRYKVIFDNEGARFVLKDWFFEIGIPFKNNNNKEMEVIGNIYENPELMEDE